MNIYKVYRGVLFKCAVAGTDGLHNLKRRLMTVVSPNIYTGEIHKYYYPQNISEHFSAKLQVHLADDTYKTFHLSKV